MAQPFAALKCFPLSCIPVFDPRFAEKKRKGKASDPQRQKYFELSRRVYYTPTRPTRNAVKAKVKVKIEYFKVYIVCFSYARVLSLP